MEQKYQKAKELRDSIQEKWKVLERVRVLGASPNILVSIRRKIYEEQDELIELTSKNDIVLKGDIVNPPKHSYFSRRDR